MAVATESLPETPIGPPVGEAETLDQSALIHISASAVSMIVGESVGKNKASFEVLEVLAQPLPVAEEIFRDGALSRHTIERCVAILHRYQESLMEYGLGPEYGVVSVATNIVSEASNCELFLNRLQVACHLDVRPLDEGDMTRLVYLDVARLLRRREDWRKSCLMVVHVGPGHTRLMLFEKGRIASYSSYRIGAHRVAEAVDRLPSDSDRLTDLIKGHINGLLEQMDEEFKGMKVDVFMALGKEIQPAVRHLADLSDNVVVDTKKLEKLARKLTGMEEGDIASLLGVDIYTAGAMVAGIQCNLSIAERFQAAEIHVPPESFEETFLADLMRGEFSTKRFGKEVIQSALALGKRYKFDRKHGEHVADLASTLFDELRLLHGLSAHDRLLLQVAAILHEVGDFISRRSHHKHSLYIIQNSEIFGLNDEETTVVGLVTRYHRKALPDSSHAVFRDLPRSDRIRVSKLAAILRVADALDRGHHQRLPSVRPTIEGDKLLLYVGRTLDTRVEELAMRSKADLFEQVFGLEVVIASE